MKIEERLVTDFYINDIRMSDEFMIIPGLSEEAVICVTTLQSGASNWILNTTRSL